MYLPFALFIFGLFVYFGIRSIIDFQRGLLAEDDPSKIPVVSRDRASLQRILSLLAGLIYCLMLSMMLSVALDRPFATMMLLVVCGTIVLSLILGFLSVRFIRDGRRVGQFSLSSWMLVILAAAIFLVPIGALFRSIDNDPPLPLQQWLLIVVFALTCVAASLFLLVFLADAVVWVFLCATRWICLHIRHKNGPQKKE
jgi:hypothetical protein